MAEAFCNNLAWPQPQPHFKEGYGESWYWCRDTFLRFKKAYSSTSDYLLAEAPKAQQRLPVRFLLKVMDMKLDGQGIE
jgi:hypothetical protein